MSSNEIEALRVKLCSLAEQVAASFGVSLDYTDASVETVEYILGKLHNQYLRSNSEEGLFGLALEFGAYLVSVLQRHHGAAIWQRDHVEFGVNSLPVQRRDATLFPVNWCMKRIIDGPADDIVSKWQAFVLARESRTAS
jgi:hypothetical protein